MSNEATANWISHFHRRFQTIRGSLRSLQLDLDAKSAANPKSNALKELAREFEAVNRAFEVMNINKPAMEPFDPLVKGPGGRRPSGEVAT